MQAIYKRELKSYFCSMIAYVFIAVTLFVLGLNFYSYNLKTGYAYFSYALVTSTFFFLPVVSVLTMRSFAEERKNKTDQLLLTSPVSVPSIVFGKYLSMVTILAIPLLISCLFPLIISTFGSSYFLVDYSSILAFFLMNCVFISVGMFVSSMTENQIIAAVVTFLALFVMYMWDNFIGFIPTTASASVISLLIIVIVVAFIIYAISHNKVIPLIVGAVGIAVILVLYFSNASSFEGVINNLLSSFSIMSTVTSFSVDSVFDVGGIIRYLVDIALFVFLTMQSIQKRRWS